MSPSSRGSSPLRLSSLVQRAILVVTVTAMLLFALPLALVTSDLYRGRAQEHLARDAERARAVLTDDVLHDPDPGRITRVMPPPHDRAVTVGVYDGSGQRVGGAGPDVADELTRTVAATRVEESAHQGGELITAVPLVDDRSAPSPFVVRAAEPYALVQRDLVVTWALIAALALGVLALMVALSRTLAHRLARPLNHLADSAEALGQGDFSVRARRSGVREVDAVSDNLERTARRLGAVLERERAFSADASHQLRGPLTAVRVGLEAASLTPGADLGAAVRDALDGLDRLERTVLDLLTLARDTGHGEPCARVGDLVRDVADPWSVRLARAGRALVVAVDEPLPPAAASEPTLRTVLDVLLDNALTHGGGTVRVAARADEDTLTLEVADQGEGLPDSVEGLEMIFVRRSPEARGTGIGLSLARSLIEADGGRLEVTSRRPAVFAVVLPAGRARGPGDDQPASEPLGAS
ncbi:MAG: HAMP domain-containing histidine kinase [Kineosporiaceae bacterium]|nr:HAMP domain-containing histidine kinase [Kineosporiaceae bacterium]